MPNSFLLNITEHENVSANKYENANYCWHFQIYLQRKFHAQLSWAWEIKMKMPTIVGIFIFISRENFMLIWVEHEKTFITSGSGFGNETLPQVVWESQRLSLTTFQPGRPKQVLCKQYRSRLDVSSGSTLFAILGPLVICRNSRTTGTNPHQSVPSVTSQHVASSQTGTSVEMYRII